MEHFAQKFSFIPMQEEGNKMDYTHFVNGIKRFGSTERDICIQGIGVTPEQIHENVVACRNFQCFR